MSEDLILDVIKARRELIDTIREKLPEAGGAMAVAKKLKFTKSNLWYHLNYDNPTTDNLQMLTKISETVAGMITERKKEALQVMEETKQQLLNA